MHAFQRDVHAHSVLPIDYSKVRPTYHWIFSVMSRGRQFPPRDPDFSSLAPHN